MYNFLVWSCDHECVPDPRRIRDNPHTVSHVFFKAKVLIAVALTGMALPATPIADITQYSFVFLLK